ncbi:MAG: recombinase family protein [Elusimicrobiota bacterium]
MNEITPKIAAAYARQSTVYQTKSIPDQIAELKKAAEKRGITLLDDLIFTDEKTGTTVKNRDGFEALRKAALDGTLKQRGVNTLLYWATDRLARETGDALMFEADMARSGITCLSVTEAYDVRTLGGKTMFTMRSLLAEAQNKRRAIDIRRGQRSAVLGGKYIFEAPFGFEKNVEKRLCINVPEAQVIRRMFHALLAGKSPRQITRMLNEAKLPSHRGKKWQHAHVARMLRNEIYAGLVVHGFGKRKNRKRDTAIVQPFHHPAIIDWDMFIAAQKVLDERSRSRRFTRTIRHFYLLGGLRLLKCGVCGKAMAGKRCVSDGVDYFYYQCLSRASTGQGCGLGGVQCRVLDEIVLAQLQTYAGDRKKIDEAWAKHHQAIAPQVQPAQEEITAIDQKLAGLRQRQDRLVAAFSEAKVALPVLQGHVKQLKDESERLEARRLDLKREIDKISKTMADGGVLDKLADFRKTFDGLSDEGKKMVIRTFVASITIKARDQFEIALRFLPQSLIVSTAETKVSAAKENQK